MRGQPLRTREEWVRHNIETQVHPENVAQNPQRYVDQFSKQWARRQAVNAVSRGDLVKPSACSECGRTPPSSSDIHGHHTDYDRPLDVIWLCKNCHEKTHKGFLRK